MTGSDRKFAWTNHYTRQRKFTGSLPEACQYDQRTSDAAPEVALGYKERYYAIAWILRYVFDVYVRSLRVLKDSLGYFTQRLRSLF